MSHYKPCLYLPYFGLGQFDQGDKLIACLKTLRKTFICKSNVKSNTNNCQKYEVLLLLMFYPVLTVLEKVLCFALISRVEELVCTKQNNNSPTAFFNF